MRKAESSKPAARPGRQLVKAGKAPAIADGPLPPLLLPDLPDAAAADAGVVEAIAPAEPLAADAGAIVPLAEQAAILPAPQELSLDLFCGGAVATPELLELGGRDLSALAAPQAHADATLPDGDCSPLHPFFIEE